MIRIIILLCLMTSACSPVPVSWRPPFGRALDRCRLRNPASLGGDRFWRERFIAEFGSRRKSFDAVLEKTGDTLRLVALLPYAGSAFVLTNRAGAVHYDSDVGLRLPISPCRLLLDIERAYFPLDGATDPPPRDGERAVSNGIERVVERWRGGRLRERTYVRLRRGHVVGGNVHISYDSAGSAGAPARRIVVDNAVRGYRLTIVTHE